jgi:hypothetical protein
MSTSYRPLRTTACLAAVFLNTALLGAAVQAAPDAAFDSAFQQFNSASGGEAAAVDKAVDAFEALLKAEPANPVLMAYAGASTALKSTTTMLPWKKMGYAEDGMALLDKAIAQLTPAHDAPLQHGTPSALEVKFVAANTFLAVPGFMNRGARGSKLLNEVLASPLLATAPLPFRGTVWMRAARLAQAEQRPADARRWLEEIVRQGAPQAEAARARLKEIAA